MRLAERHREPVEAHFTEGELDLEPPEELAIAELDEEAILEEELDNEDILEQDVDEDTLAETLEHLVHGSDDDVAGEDAEDATDGEDAREVEEGLDLVLLERLDLLDRDGSGGPGGDGNDEGALLLGMTTDSGDQVEVAPCGSGEFVCRSCFLVRRQVQLVDATAMVCGDCST